MNRKKINLKVEGERFKIQIDVRTGTKVNFSENNGDQNDIFCQNGAVALQITLYRVHERVTHQRPTMMIHFVIFPTSNNNNNNKKRAKESHDYVKDVVSGIS